MVNNRSALPTSLTGNEEWELKLASESQHEGGNFAVLSDATFDLFPIHFVDDEDRYYRALGSLGVTVKDLNLGAKTIEFKVRDIHMLGVRLKKMLHAAARIKSVSGGSMILEKIEGLIYEEHDVDWELHGPS